MFYPLNSQVWAGFVQFVIIIVVGNLISDENRLRGVTGKACLVNPHEYVEKAVFGWKTGNFEFTIVERRGIKYLKRYRKPGFGPAHLIFIPIN